MLHEPSPLHEPPAPDPTGIEAPVRTGLSVDGEVPGPRGALQAAPADDLRRWVEANHQSLEWAEAGLKRECQVTLPRSEQELQSHMDRTSDLRQLWRLLS